MGGEKGEERSEAYLLGWPTCFCLELGLWVPREGLLELGAGMTGRGRKTFEADLPDSLEMEAESRARGRQVICYKVWGETGGLIWRRGGRGEDPQLGYLPSCLQWPKDFQEIYLAVLKWQQFGYLSSL